MKGSEKTLITAILFFTSLAFSNIAWARQNTVEDCQECHEDEDLTTERDGKEVSLQIDTDKFENSVHGDLRCGQCHPDLDKAELPHDDVEIARAKCDECHEEMSARYAKSWHGQSVAKGAKLAPHCGDCHGSHYISEVSDPASKVAKFNIPMVCGTCHKEGTAVSEKYDIPQDKILAHFSQSIHGIGLFKQGLTVTAVCTDCHTSHDLQPHTDERSTIHRDNVAQTCQKCHGLIEQVHKKVIRGELWEKEPHKVPVCVDCHSPHKVRKVFYQLGMADQDCLVCHGKEDLSTVRDDQKVSMFVDVQAMKGTAHDKVACAQCHTGISPVGERPCSTIRTKVDCSICHAEVVAEHATSTHGKRLEHGDTKAPACFDCHGDHTIRKHGDELSPTYPTNQPDLCGKCHREGSTVAQRPGEREHNIISSYTMSIHGKGLLESGLTVTAVCSDCHTAHHELPSDNPESSMHDDNIAETCGQCHKGIFRQFANSIHSPTKDRDGEEPKGRLPTCKDCHSSHSIERTDEKDFKLVILDQCGKCHKDVTESYFDTFHGKVSRLGYEATAKCHDCHGAHNILPTWDPDSTLSRDNIVETCRTCHPGSNRQFAGYLTHATHHDKDKYPILYYTFWFMALLLIGVFSFFGIHTLLWLPRSLKERRKHKELLAQASGKSVMRFTPLQRQLHFLVIVSFLGLAITGMTLKFSYAGWAQALSSMLGGFESAAFIHRLCAIITFFYFGAHLLDVLARKRRSGKSWFSYLFGSDSLVPNRRDLSEFIATLKWFLGAGPRPQYGRWTYWEKFDYLAVFWGVAIIGSTGLVLWFPEFFTMLLPGWSINVATIIHSDEALLATGFIFTIHFFNTHFRPEKFPMDKVIFTGRIPLEEFREERPREYKELVESGQLEKLLVDPLPPSLVKAMKIFGTSALVIGLGLVLLIIYAEVFGYR